MSSAKSIIICVFCGSAPGKNPAYIKAANALAHAMHAAGAKLVYGGGTVGMMGEVARTLVQLSGPKAVHGIIPQALVKYEQAGLDGADTGNNAASSAVNANGTPTPDAALYGRTTVVKDMHTRKRMMADEVLAGAPGSGFVALPGGYGTMEELMEITTWNQLGIHSKPVCLLNTNGFYDGILHWVDTAVKEGFISEVNRSIVAESKEPDGVLKTLASYVVSEGRYKLNWDVKTPADEEKESILP